MFGEHPIEDAWLKVTALMMLDLHEGGDHPTGDEMRLMRRVLTPLVEASVKAFPSEVMDSIEFWIKSGPNDHGRFRSSEIVRQNRECREKGIDPHTDEMSEKIWAEAERIADERLKELHDTADANKAGLVEWFAKMRRTVKCEKCGEDRLLLTAFENGQKHCVECRNQQYRDEHGGKDAWTMKEEQEK